MDNLIKKWSQAGYDVEFLRDDQYVQAKCTLRGANEEEMIYFLFDKEGNLHTNAQGIEADLLKIIALSSEYVRTGNEMIDDGEITLK